MSIPILSVVTISFNQASFLERTIRSVLEQDYPAIEYIIVDPGSTDGSRDIIQKYKALFSRAILESDNGAADGLNKGFANATGDIFCYLNSDDEFLPGAFRRVVSEFENRPDADVLCGHAYIVDADGRRLRRVWSDPFNKRSQAHGMSVQIQPSTFIRRKAFQRSSGFNEKNKIAWDGELIISLAKSGSKIEVFDDFLSLYRVHETSITGAGSYNDLRRAWNDRRFYLLMGRERRTLDKCMRVLFFLTRQLRNPRAFLERFLRGPVFRRAAGRKST